MPLIIHKLNASEKYHVQIWMMMIIEDENVVLDEHALVLELHQMPCFVCLYHAILWGTNLNSSATVHLTMCLMCVISVIV